MKQGNWKTLWALMRGDRLLYLAALAWLGLSAVLHSGASLVTGLAVDYLICGKPLPASGPVREVFAWLGGQSMLARNLWIAGGAVVLLRASGSLLLYLRSRWSARASESIALRLRDRLYDRLQRLPCRYLDKAETGDLVQRCTSDVETIRTFLSGQVVEILRAVVLLVCGVAVMLYLNVPMTLVSLAMVPVLIVFAVVFFGRIRRAFQRSDEAEGLLTAVAQENLTGIRVVRAFARQRFERDKFGRANAEYRDRWYRLIHLNSWYWSLSDLMCFVQNGLVLVVGGWWMLEGRIGLGALVTFTMVVNMYLWPVRMLGRVLSETGQAVVSLSRVRAILEEPAEQDAPRSAPAGAAPFAGRIDVRDLSFSFGDGGPVLRGVSLEVPAGTTLALMGPSGSGKSVLVSLLLRLYDYQDGAIQIDGREIRSLPRSAVRSQIGVVLQEPFVYSRSVRENIRLGHSAADDGQVEQVARAACLHDNILAFRQGYDSLVGERGVTLSGGQRQRLALARALVKDPPILVLDDALSAVDTVTEQMILEAIQRRHGRRTTVVIAHRLSTLQRADQIVVLDRGRVVQRGRHGELIGRDGPYRRLWDIQMSLGADLNGEPRAK